MSFRRLSALFAVDSLVFTPFRTFASLYFLDYMSAEKLGELFMLANVGRIVGTAIAGPLADRIGRKPPLAAFFATSYLLAPLVFVHPRVFYPLMNVFRSAYILIADVAIYELTPEEESKSFGYALSLSFTDVAYIASLMSFAYIFGNDYSAIRIRIQELAPIGLLLGLAIILATSIPKPAGNGKKGSYVEIIKDSRILIYVLLVSAYRLFAPLIFIFGVPLLYSKGLLPEDISFILSATAFVEIFLAPAVSKLARPTTLYLIGQYMRMLSRILIAISSSRPILIFLYAAAVLAYMFLGPAGGAMDAGIMPEEARSTGVSLVRFATTITYTIGSYIAGIAYASLGAMAFIVFPAIMLSIATAVGIYVRRLREL